MFSEGGIVNLNVFGIFILSKSIIHIYIYIFIHNGKVLRNEGIAIRKIASPITRSSHSNTETVSPASYRGG